MTIPRRRYQWRRPAELSDSYIKQQAAAVDKPGVGTSIANLQPPFVAPVSLSRILQARRDYVTEQLEGVCQRNVKPRILSVANGSLREAEPILPLCSVKGGEFVAVDHSFTGSDEPVSCAIRRIEGGVFSLFRNEGLGRFHFIYALNVFTELQTPAAQRLLKRLAGMLHRGGTLLLSNFTPVLSDWAHLVPWLPSQPIYRTEEEISRLTACISERDIMGHAVWRDDSGAVAYLEVQR